MEISISPSSVLEYFLGPNINIYMSNSTQGVPRPMELTISPTAWPINRSLGLFFYIGVYDHL